MLRTTDSSSTFFVRLPAWKEGNGTSRSGIKTDCPPFFSGAVLLYKTRPIQLNNKTVTEGKFPANTQEEDFERTAGIKHTRPPVRVDFKHIMMLLPLETNKITYQTQFTGSFSLLPTLR